MYAVPDAYEENGNWQEIDNRLESAVQGGKRIYQNKASRVHVCFAEQAGDEKLVSVEKGWKRALLDYGDSERNVRKRRCKRFTGDFHTEKCEGGKLSGVIRAGIS